MAYCRVGRNGGMSVRAAAAEPKWRPRAGVAAGTAAPSGARLRAVLQVGQAHVAAQTGGTIAPSGDLDPIEWNRKNAATSRALRVYVQNRDLETFTKEALVFTLDGGTLHRDSFQMLKDVLTGYMNNYRASPWKLVHKGSSFDVGSEGNVIAEKLPSKRRAWWPWYKVGPDGNAEAVEVYQAAQQIRELLLQGMDGQLPPAIRILRDPTRSVVVEFHVQSVGNMMGGDRNAHGSLERLLLQRGDDDKLHLLDGQAEKLVEGLQNLMSTAARNSKLMTVGFQKPDLLYYSNAVAFRKGTGWNLTSADFEKAVKYVEDAASKGIARPRVNFYDDVR